MSLADYAVLILTNTAFYFDRNFPFATRLAAIIIGVYQTLCPSRQNSDRTWIWNILVCDTYFEPLLQIKFGRKVGSLVGIDLGDIILFLIGLELLIWSIGDRFGWLPGLTSIL